MLIFGCSFVCCLWFFMLRMVRLRGLSEAEQILTRGWKRSLLKGLVTHLTFWVQFQVIFMLTQESVIKRFDFQGGFLLCSPCRDRPDCGVLRMPVRRLCANNGETSASPEHRHHVTHSEDDRGGEQTPQSARVDDMGGGFLSLGAVTSVRGGWVQELCSFPGFRTSVFCKTNTAWQHTTCSLELSHFAPVRWYLYL